MLVSQRMSESLSVFLQVLTHMAEYEVRCPAM